LIALRLSRGSYIGLTALQPVWHALLPPPAGTGSWAVAVAATLPLLLPLRGVWRGSLRPMIWAGYLGMLYLVVGVMEAWANPPQGAVAGTQIFLVTVFVGSVLVFSRQEGARK